MGIINEVPHMHVKVGVAGWEGMSLPCVGPDGPNSENGSPAGWGLHCPVLRLTGPHLSKGSRAGWGLYCPVWALVGPNLSRGHRLGGLYCPVLAMDGPNMSWGRRLGGIVLHSVSPGPPHPPCCCHYRPAAQLQRLGNLDSTHTQLITPVHNGGVCIRPNSD